MSRPRSRLLIAAMYIGLMVLLLICGLHMVQSRRAAARAAENLATCRQLAEQIDLLKAVPTHASLERQSLQALSLRIEQAAQIAGIAESAIVRISPQAGRRVKDSAHIEQPTTVQFRQISLKQLVGFLVELSASQSGLQATSVRLTAPRTPPADQQGETWSVEVVLTQLIFSPEYAARPSQVSPREVSG